MTLATVLLLALAVQRPEPAPSLSLNLACGEQPSEVTLVIRNSGSVDTAVLLGIALGNGRQYYPRELAFELHRPVEPTVERLGYRTPVDVAGRIDHWVVTLPVSGAFTLTFRPSDFITTTSSRADTPPTEMLARLTGRSVDEDLSPDMAGWKTWQMWTGTASSNLLPLSNCMK